MHERRDSKREPLFQFVTLISQRCGSIPCAIINRSTNGLGLIWANGSGRDFSHIRPGEIVLVRVMETGDGEMAFARAHGCVVHASSYFIGLSLQVRTESLFRHRQRVLPVLEAQG